MTRKKHRTLIVFAIILLASILAALLANLGIYIIERILYPLEYEDIVKKYSKEYNVPEYIILSIINIESSFDPEAVSVDGAMGLMQMLPSTFTWLSSFEHLNENLPTESLFDPDVSIRYGTYYLKYLFEKFYNWETVYAAYNGGEGNIALLLDDPEYSDGKGNITKFPKIKGTFDLTETEKYVQKAKDNVEHYRDTYYKN